MIAARAARRGRVSGGVSSRLTAPVLVRRFTARPDRIAAVRHEVRDCAERNGAADPDAVALAVTEAITNAVVHAYVGASEPGDIEVVVQCLPDDESIEILVCDEGRGMMPRPDSPGLGLGLPLVATLAERFEVQARAGGGTRVLMAFATG
jgi:serine/threonine-protein kinase RsbW